MKYLLTGLLLILFIGILGKPNAKPDPNAIVHVTGKALAQAPEPVEPTVIEPVVAVATPIEPPAPVEPTCASEIAKYDWPRSIALAVATAESGLNPKALGDTHLTYVSNGITYGNSWGCFQIRYLEGRPNPEQLMNATNNVEYAYKMYKSSGWYPWSVFNNGKYLKYLNQ